MTYASTHGTSMEPGFTAGDLALLSPADSYSVGDVVAYPSASLKTIVMHRIVSVESGGFVTQGDNNDWLDEDRPTQDQILGRFFFRIPQGGTALNALRSPAVFLPLLVVVGAVLGAGARKPPLRRSLRAAPSRRRAARTSLPVPPAGAGRRPVAPTSRGSGRTRCPRPPGLSLVGPLSGQPLSSWSPASPVASCWRSRRRRARRAPSR
jgi:signal peptidase I